MAQEAVGVSLSTTHFGSAQRVRGHATLATLEMKTHGENNKLIGRSILAARSPRVTLVLWTEKEAPVKTPPPSSDRGTLTLTLSKFDFQRATNDDCGTWLFQLATAISTDCVKMSDLCEFFILGRRLGFFPLQIKTGNK